LVWARGVWFSASGGSGKVDAISYPGHKFGIVTKIRIRATAITNGDRQDFVVPNKRLITGSLLNWTLNAAVNRITIRLGVACGSDTGKARQILRDIAADHPLVLADPAPMATFEQFGDSSLNLVLYAYLPDLDNRTISELHTEIDKRFAAAGIDIPNPQFDFHLLRDRGGMGG
jgi:potassium efflux system protein